MRGLKAALICIVAALVVAALPPNAAFRVKLTRPWHPGDRYKFTSSVTTTNLLALNGAWPAGNGSGKCRVDLVSEVTVLDVNGRGGSTKELHKIIKFTRTEGGASTEILKQGDEITASLEKRERVFRRGKEPVSSEEAQVLSVVIAFDSRRAMDDEVFGTDGYRKIGDSWPVNPEAMARDVRDECQVKKEDISGTVKLAGVSKIEGTECLCIEADVKLSHIVAPMPKRSVLKSASMGMVFSGKYPVDPSLPAIESSSTVTSTATAVRREERAAPVEVYTRMVQERLERYEPIR